MTGDRKKKIAGTVLIGLAVLTLNYGFIIAGVLFVVVGVSLIMNVNLWRR